MCEIFTNVRSFLAYCYAVAASLQPPFRRIFCRYLFICVTNIYIWISSNSGFTCFQRYHASKFQSCKLTYLPKYKPINLYLFHFSYRQWVGTSDWNMLHHSKIAISFGFSIMQEPSIQLWVLSGKDIASLALFISYPNF